VGRIQNPRLCLSYNQKPRAKLTTTAKNALAGVWQPRHAWERVYVASQDLDIRGAANLLGERAIRPECADVGFELVPIHAEDGDRPKISRARMEGPWNWNDDGQVATANQSSVPVLIPEELCADLDVRPGLYRRFVWADTKVELEGLLQS